MDFTELSNYINQMQAKMTLLARTLNQQSIGNLIKIEQFLAEMLPSIGVNNETQPQQVLQQQTVIQQRPRRHYNGQGVGRYSVAYKQYKTNGGKLLWWDFIKYAKTGNVPPTTYPSPISTLQQNVNQENK